MTRYTSRADLLIAAGESIKMQEKAGIEPVFKSKYGIEKMEGINFTLQPDHYEFPIAVVEGNPVFVGDELYMINPEPRTGDKVTIEYSPDAYGNLTVRTKNGAVPTVNLSQLSWNPPKPKTVMVELLREDAEVVLGTLSMYPLCASINRAEEAISKALEKA